MDVLYWKPNVWVIDDAELDSIIIKLSIQKIYKDALVKIVSNGRAAIDMLVDFTSFELGGLPDIIFLDLDMPGMSGWEFLNQLKLLNMELLRRIPIYIVSGTISPVDVKKSQSDPLVANYFHKPVSLDALKSIFEAERPQ